MQRYNYNFNHARKIVIILSIGERRLERLLSLLCRATSSIAVGEGGDAFTPFWVSAGWKACFPWAQAGRLLSRLRMGCVIVVKTGRLHSFILKLRGGWPRSFFSIVIIDFYFYVI